MRSLGAVPPGQIMQAKPHRSMKSLCAAPDTVTAKAGDGAAAYSISKLLSAGAQGGVPPLDTVSPIRPTGVPAGSMTLAISGLAGLVFESTGSMPNRALMRLSRAATRMLILPPSEWPTKPTLSGSMRPRICIAEGPVGASSQSISSIVLSRYWAWSISFCTFCITVMMP